MHTCGLIRTALFLSILHAPSLAGATWHVDINGTAPGSGTLADPYTSIQFAIDQESTVANDILLVAPGTYVENVDVHNKILVIVARHGPEMTTIQAAGPGPVVTLGAEQIFAEPELRGFTVTGALGTDAGIFIPSSPNDATGIIRGCIVRDNGGPGVLVHYDGFVHDSTMVGNGRPLVSEGMGWARVYSSIMWDNTQPMLLNMGFPHVITNVLQDEDPKFWNLAARDLHLRPDSPAVNVGGGIDLGALAFDPFYAPGTSNYCPGTAALCPCGNGGTGTAGCDIAQGTGGVAIDIQNFTPDGAGGGTAEILGTGYPPMSLPGVTLIRSLAVEDPPAVFGDGLRCISSAGLVRVRATLASGGNALLPVMHGAGAGTFFYQLWNRNTPIMFCDPNAAFNLSDALEIVWP
jgi:hypothetical protein